MHPPRLLSDKTRATAGSVRAGTGRRRWGGHGGGDPPRAPRCKSTEAAALHWAIERRRSLRKKWAKPPGGPDRCGTASARAVPADARCQTRPPMPQHTSLPRSTRTTCHCPVPAVGRPAAASLIAGAMRPPPPPKTAGDGARRRNRPARRDPHADSRRFPTPGRPVLTRYRIVAVRGRPLCHHRRRPFPPSDCLGARCGRAPTCPTPPQHRCSAPRSPPFPSARPASHPCRPPACAACASFIVALAPSARARAHLIKKTSLFGAKTE